MALNRIFWMTEIQNELFADNTFYSFATDHSEYVLGKTVSIPNVNTQVSVLTNDTGTFPGTVQTRTDAELTYNMDEFKTLPFTVKNLEEAEFSYDKKMSIMTQMLGALKDAVANKCIYNWAYQLPSTSKIASTGSARVAYKSFQTSTRKALTYADFVSAMQVLDAQNIPQEGRKILVSGGILADIRKFLTSYYSDPITTSVISKGSIGTLLGADVYVRGSYNTYFDPSGTTLEVTTTTGATYSDFALIWHPSCVSKAFGSLSNSGIQVFESEAPEYWGQLFSALVRAGASKMRTNKEGVALIYEAA